MGALSVNRSFLFLSSPSWFYQTVTHMRCALGGTNGANEFKQYTHSYQKVRKRPQRTRNHIRTGAHNRSVGGLSALPTINKPLKFHDFSGFLNFLLLFLAVHFFALGLTQTMTQMREGPERSIPHWSGRQPFFPLPDTGGTGHMGAGIQNKSG